MTESFKEMVELAINGAFGANLLGAGGTVPLLPPLPTPLLVDEMDEEVDVVAAVGARRLAVDDDVEVDVEVDDDEEDVGLTASGSFATTPPPITSIGWRLGMTITGCNA